MFRLIISTGRDVAAYCEWGFATTPLIAMNCIMTRNCHVRILDFQFYLLGTDVAFMTCP